MFAERHVAARQLVETLISQQETALTELGLELGGQYQVSHAEQAQLATETANNALSDQTIGELVRLIQEKKTLPLGEGTTLNARTGKGDSDHQETILDNSSKGDRITIRGNGSDPVELSFDKQLPYSIIIDREAKKDIIARGISEKYAIFATDTATNTFASNIAKIEKEAGYYDVALHGHDTSVDFFGTTIDAYTLSQIIRQRKDYSVGTCIRLLSCNTGNTNNTGNCVAQIVANELGVIVKALTDILYVYEDGKIKIGKKNTGTMKEFYPRGREYQ